MQISAFIKQRQLGRFRYLLYPILLAIFYLSWLTFMTVTKNWILYRDHWPAALTMVLGSFVAGITAEGGGAVAFPVFTKILHIEATDARTFSLMIQTFGMNMASIFIISRRIRFLPRVVIFVSLGGLIGHIIGLFWLPLPPPYPKILFTMVTTAFGVALAISRWGLQWPPQVNFPIWNRQHKVLFVLLGIVGGLFAANVGSGIDVITFIVLTLAFGINEKVGTPTTVIIMGINSLVGFILHGIVAQDIAQETWRYWMVAVPIVVVGAPLGAFVGSKVSRDKIIIFLLTLISLELVTTLLLVPFSRQMWMVTAVVLAVCAIGFMGMLAYRHVILRSKMESMGMLFSET